MIKQNDKVTHKENGQFAKGNRLGGRKKGSKNKFTRIKEEIVSIWDDADLRGKLIRSLKSSEGKHEDVKKFVKESIVPLMEKGPQIQNTVVNQIEVGWSDEETCEDQVSASELPERDT